MDDYTKIVNCKKSKGAEEEKELVWYHQDVMKMVSGSQLEVNPSIEEANFQKSTSDEQRLNEYVLGTSIARIKVIDEFNNKISDIVNNIHNFLRDLKDCISDITEVEIIISNIIQNHKKLWELRKYREKTYSEILVLVESCVKYYDITELSLDKINTLDEVYSKLRNESVLKSYPKECRKKLQEAGFDIFRPFYIAPDKYIVVEKKKIIENER